MVDGIVELSAPRYHAGTRYHARPSLLKRSHSELTLDRNHQSRTLESKDFLNELSFFTESPLIDTVRSLTVCKMLMISKQDFMVIADDHPNSFGKILKNLLGKVQQLQVSNQDDMMTMPTLPMRMEDTDASTPNGMIMMMMPDLPTLPMQMEETKIDNPFQFQNANRRRATTVDDEDDMHPAMSRLTSDMTVMQSLTSAQIEAALATVQDMLDLHITRQKNESTTRFLLAASRDDVATIRLMCEQGFDPNSADMDYRTALMVASMNGNVKSVKRLLSYGANPQLTDHHGTCAMLEAIHNGHDKIIELLLKDQGSSHTADMMWLNDARASALLNQAVFDRDLPQLKRLVQANVNVNAKDYDGRRPIHIAASEGNLEELKVLVKAGADLDVKDRWGNSVMDEAKRSKNPGLMDYLLQSKLCRPSSANSLAGLGDGKKILASLREDEDGNDHSERTVETL